MFRISILQNKSVMYGNIKLLKLSCKENGDGRRRKIFNKKVRHRSKVSQNIEAKPVSQISSVLIYTLENGSKHIEYF